MIAKVMRQVMTPPPCLVVSSVTNFPIVMNNDFPMTNLPLPPRSRHLPVRHLSVFGPGAVHVGQGVPLLPQRTVHVDQGALGGSHIQHVTVTFIRSTAFHESSSFNKSLWPRSQNTGSCPSSVVF